MVFILFFLNVVCPLFEMSRHIHASSLLLVEIRFVEKQLETTDYDKRINFIHSFPAIDRRTGVVAYSVSLASYFYSEVKGSSPFAPR